MGVQIIIDGSHATNAISELLQLADAISSQPPFEGGLPLAEAPTVEQGMATAKELAEEAMKEGMQAMAVTEESNEAPQTGVITADMSTDVTNTSEPIDVDAPETEAPKKLSRGQHRIEANKMIEAGEINDDIFPLLSKMQQQRVVDELEKQTDETPGTESAELVSNEPQVPPQEQETAPEAQPSKGYESVIDDPLSRREEDLVDTPEITFDSLRDLIKTNGKTNNQDDPKKYDRFREIMTRVVPEGHEIKISNIPPEKLTTVYYEVAAV